MVRGTLRAVGVLSAVRGGLADLQTETCTCARQQSGECTQMCGREHVCFLTPAGCMFQCDAMRNRKLGGKYTGKPYF